MNTQNKLVTIILLLILLLNPIHGYAFFSDTCKQGPDKFKNEGSFVEEPAIVGALILGIPSSVAGLVLGIPFIPFDSGSPFLGALVGLEVGGNIGYYAVGTPFFVIKKILYDGPKKLFSRQTEAEQNKKKIKE